MSQPDSLGNPGGIYEEKPRSNVYTAMLGVSLVAMIIASALLAMELKVYNWDYKGAAVKAVKIREPSELKTAAAEASAAPAATEPPAEPATPPAAPAPAAPAAAPAPGTAAPAAPIGGAAPPAAGVPAVPVPSVPAAPAASVPGAGVPAVPAPAVPGATPSTTAPQP